jgi:hypothetical protein
MPREQQLSRQKGGSMSKSKRVQRLEGYEDLRGKGFDLAIEYIEKEIRALDQRKEELENMEDKLMARQDLFEKERLRVQF